MIVEGEGSIQDSVGLSLEETGGVKVNKYM
jgi:hypothetical protein